MTPTLHACRIGALFAVLLTSPAHAIYKCKSAEGATTYSDIPCDPSKSVERGVDMRGAGKSATSTLDISSDYNARLVKSCVDAHSHTLKDPTSVRIDRAKLTSGKNGTGILEVYIHANNSYGKQVNGEVHCGVRNANSGPVIDPKLTDAFITLGM
ncbi:DUF4124 domain-containing protein [Chitinibacteraceae bacterium HSL-7]